MARSFDLSVYLVTDRRLCGDRGMIETVRQAVAGGVTLVQLRDPDASTRELMGDANALQDILRPKAIPLIINDRVDVALAVDADGVHLGQDDMPAKEARALLGRERIVGLSVGTMEELRASEDSLPYVDYVGIGPVRGTATKPGAGQAIGAEGFRAVRERIALPAVAIGGLRSSDAAELLAAGASGLAVVSAICAAPDAAAAARALAQALRG
ncbi:thiamine-phosphate synthase [Agaricicola taiwanensis]|uniref:Thiamine-phosphate synthase n=1 Tax=Agaricicola taiwanensis TaxID=591372 RepID=A0A8J2YGC1_9RHOB|nr:thiamine phosphate synthase [Agaricicola taiwanensis]GGE34074.1 thiamine-phosphate synthase [Agaricicola taiwanensis]